MKPNVARRSFLLGVAGAHSVGEMSLAETMAQEQVGLFIDLPQTRPASTLTVLQTTGHSRPGVGSAMYRRVSGNTTTPYRGRSADGALWELAELRPTPQMFGASGDGVADDNSAFQDWLDAIQILNVQGYIPAGTYSIAELRATSVHSISIAGAGPAVTCLTRQPGVCTKDYKRLLFFRNLAGVSGHINLEGFAVDGNARNNPLVDLADRWSLQHCSEICILPTDHLGFGSVRITDIRGEDPVADLISLTGDAQRSYRSILISNISSVGRTRERSDINILGSWDQAAINNVTVDCIEIETNKPDIDPSLLHSLTLSNVNCRTYCSVYAKNAAKSPRRPKLTISGLVVGKFFSFGEMDGEITNIHANLTRACWLLKGRWKFNGGRIYIDRVWEDPRQNTVGIYWKSGSGVEELTFDGTIFDSDAQNDTVTHFVGEDSSNREAVREIVFRDVEFRSKSVKAARLNSGPYRWERTKHYYDGPGGSIDCSGGWLVPGVVNMWRLYNNELIAENSFLLQLPVADDTLPGTLWLHGNTAPAITRILLNFRPDLVAPPHGAGSVFHFRALDSGGSLPLRLGGIIYKGQQFVKLDAAVGEPMFFSCNSSGGLPSANWSPSSDFALGDAVDYRGKVYICTMPGRSGSLDQWIPRSSGHFSDGGVQWRAVDRAKLVESP